MDNTFEQILHKREKSNWSTNMNCTEPIKTEGNANSNLREIPWLLYQKSKNASIFVNSKYWKCVHSAGGDWQRTFTAALFVIAKTWKQPKCPLIVKLIFKNCGIFIQWKALQQWEETTIAWKLHRFISLQRVEQMKTNNEGKRWAQKWWPLVRLKKAIIQRSCDWKFTSQLLGYWQCCFLTEWWLQQLFSR